MPNHAIWLVNGNNLQLSGDMPRRCIWIKLHRPGPRPWEHEGFEHTPLLPWIRVHRGRILSAAVTLVRAWIKAGSPIHRAARLGGFQSWVDVLGSILFFGGEKGFMHNQSQLIGDSDMEDLEWSGFLSALRDYFEKPFTVNDLQYAGSELENLRPLFPSAIDELFEGPRLSSPRKLGWVLRRCSEVQFSNGFMLKRCGKNRTENVAAWQVVSCQD